MNEKPFIDRIAVKLRHTVGGLLESVYNKWHCSHDINRITAEGRLFLIDGKKARSLAQ